MVEGAATEMEIQSNYTTTTDQQSNVNRNLKQPVQLMDEVEENLGETAVARVLRKNLILQSMQEE